MTAEQRKPCMRATGRAVPAWKNVASAAVSPCFGTSATMAPRSSIRRCEMNLAPPSPNAGAPTAAAIDKRAHTARISSSAAATVSGTASRAICR